MKMPTVSFGVCREIDFLAFFGDNETFIHMILLDSLAIPSPFIA